MKTMTCKQLGGACDERFQAHTFEEMAELSKQHAMIMFQQQDEEHYRAMMAMQELMKDPTAMENWFANKRDEFDALPEDNPSN